MCFERIRVSSWRRRAEDLVRDSPGMGGEPLRFASRSGVNTEFAGGEKDSGGKEGSGRHTGRESCWHTESGRPKNAQPSRSHELDFIQFQTAATSVRQVLAAVQRFFSC